MIEKPFSMSVKVFLTEEGGRYLLLRRSKSSKSNAGKWDFPGGKVDPGENFDKALIREVVEETGLTISLIRLIGASEAETVDRRIIYIFMRGHRESGEVCLSDEHDDYAWAEHDQLLKFDLIEQFRKFVLDQINKIE